MNYLFVKPVTLSIDIIPYPGIPLLISILENNGINSEYINLNTKYNKSITKEKFLLEYENIKKFYDEEYNNSPQTFQMSVLSYKKILNKNLKWTKNNLKNYDIYKKIIDNRKYKDTFVYMYYCMTYITNIKLMSPLLYLSNAYGTEEKLVINPSDVIFMINNPINNLKTFYEQQVEELLKKKPDIIGIQLTLGNEVLSAFNLAYVIKQKAPNVHITFGGNYLETKYSDIENINELFSTFFDSFSIGESQDTVLDLARACKKEIPISEVSNLAYLKNAELKVNKKDVQLKINEYPFESFEGYQNNDYCLSELILPIRATGTYSCYWGKCIYCLCSTKENKYKILSAKRVVDEIEYLSKKYNTKYFAFWDNSIHPKFLNDISDLILERKLDVSFNLYARLEEGFTYELLKKAKKAGCVAIHWGLDSASERLLKLIKKGINLKNSEQVLKDSTRVGIYNFLYLIFGLPTETKKDIKENYNFVVKNRRYIDSLYSIEDLVFSNDSVINLNKDYYKSLICQDDDYIKYKEQIISKLNDMTYSSPSSFIINQWGYIILKTHGKFRFKIAQKIIYIYFSTKNKLVKKILNFYFKYTLNRLKEK